MSCCSSGLSRTWCHTRAYFSSRWDLQIFTEVTCATIGDFTSFIFLTCRTLDAILGHIFCFRWGLWIFTYAAWSMIDDFMSPNFRPVMHPMPYWGIFPFWVRCTDLRGGHVLDNRWFHVARFRTCCASGAHIGAYFPFRMRFTDFHGGHMCDDGWFHDICSLDLSRTWCHTGAIFRFGESLWIFTEVTCSRIDDSMLSDLRPIIHFDATLGHIPHLDRDL